MILWTFPARQWGESCKINRISTDRGEGDNYSRQESHHIVLTIRGTYRVENSSEWLDHKEHIGREREDKDKTTKTEKQGWRCWLRPDYKENCSAIGFELCITGN